IHGLGLRENAVDLGMVVLAEGPFLVFGERVIEVLAFLIGHEHHLTHAQVVEKGLLILELIYFSGAVEAAHFLFGALDRDEVWIGLDNHAAKRILLLDFRLGIGG